ncbi:MAG: hypothetical protein LQ344_005465 [Seirophora lacunosa]|nr:MAG: hypothetical protein LQ344_005465 [Seirophora lacunosa]
MMSSRNDYRLEDFSTSAEHRPISSRSRNSQAPSEEESAQNPFVDQSDNLGNSHPSQPYDPGSGNNLLSGEIEQPYAHDQTFLREWKLELLAWLVAAMSVVSLISVFAGYKNKPLRQWTTDITPATTVAIISQIGQTCVLAPVTACICIPGTEETITYRSIAGLKIVAAITDGLLRQDISPSDVKGSCLTGNCTWGVYQSMGVCATVADVSSTITAKCRTLWRDPNHAGCNYSVPAIDRNPTAGETVFETSRLDRTLWVGASNSLGFKPPGNTLVQFYVIYVPDLTSWSESMEYADAKDHKEQLIALQATLSLCLHKYNSSMTSSVMNTALLGTDIDLDWQTSHEILEGRGFGTVTVTHDGERFWMSVLNQKSLYDYLSIQTFTGTASSSVLTATQNDVVGAISESLYKDGAGIRGLSALLDNLAVSMSNALRTTTDLGYNVSGTSTSFEVYIDIEWVWMVVPIATVILSLIFLLVTIRLSRRSKIPAWKSSLLAVLLGLSPQTRSDFGGIRRPKEMEATAKDKNVRLEANAGQWQVVKAD